MRGRTGAWVASRPGGGAVSFLFLLSGTAGLVYEVLWAKHLGLYLGSTAVAQSLVLAVFLGGLSLGNAFFGPRADRAPAPLVLYGLLELGIGLLGLSSPYLLSLLGALSEAAAMGGWVVVLLPSAFLMGGTLPVLSRWAAPTLREMRSGVSWFYFINSAGACIGALLAGLVLIPRYGLNAPLVMAAVVNLVVGTAALALAHRGGGPEVAQPPAGGEEDSQPLADGEEDSPAALRDPRILYPAVFLSGFVFLIYEVSWIRILALALGSSAYAFSLMLGAVIAGIALGGLAAGGRLAAGRDPALLFAVCQFGAALSVLAALPFYERVPYYSMVLLTELPRRMADFRILQSLQFGICFALVSLPTVFLGAGLPLASRAAARAASGIGANVGWMFGLNTLGNVLGSLTAGLLLMPLMGVEGLMKLGVALNMLVGTAVLLTLTGGAPQLRVAFCAICAAALALFHVLSPPLDRLILASGVFRTNVRTAPTLDEFRAILTQEKILFYRDDRDATITVTEDARGVRRLKVNGKTDASTGSDMQTQRLLAHLPLILYPDAKSVLNVGLGSGASAGAALLHPIRRIDTVEISRGVVDAEKYFREHNNSPLDDRRHRLFVEDAKVFLRRSHNRYDIIISEPSNPWIAGIGNLFSTEYYRDAKEHLAPGGMMVQWFHLYEMTDEVLRVVLRTYAESFSHVTLWSLYSNDILLVGSDVPPSLDAGRMEEALARGAVREDLERYVIGDLSTLLSLQAGSDVVVRGMAGTGRVNRNLFPVLEYEAPKALFLSQESRLIDQADQRLDARGGRDLMLTEYLKARGRYVDRREIENMTMFHRRFGGPVYRSLLREWLRLHPGDSAAKNLLRHGRLGGELEVEGLKILSDGSRGG